MNEPHCRCPGCGECSAHANQEKLKAELRRLHEVNQELLEALEWCAGTSYIDTANQVAVEAIKKATGESK
jgi:hypothetical protein